MNLNTLEKNHTSGPWLLTSSPYDDGTPYFRIQTEDNLYDDDTGENFGFSAIMSEANARLIVAAPTILDALIAVAEWAQDTAAMAEGDEDRAVHDIILAAIAAAQVPS